MHRVLDLGQRDLDLVEAQLVALVDVQRAGQGRREECGGPSPTSTLLEVRRRPEPLPVEGERRVPAAIARDRPGDVVVRQHPGGRSPDRGVCRERRVDRRAQAGGVPGPGHEVEVEGGVQLVRPQVAGETLDVLEPHLADQDTRAGIPVGDRPPRPIDVVELVAVVDGMGARPGLGRDLRHVGVLDQQRGGVDADPGGAAIEPEAEDRFVLGTDVGVVPVEVRLLGREQVQVPLAGRAVGLDDAGPGLATLELRRPAGRRLVAAGPRPGRNQNRARSGEPGPAASAAWNQAWRLETWLGTTSMIVRIPWSSASAMSASASARVPKAGSMAR